MLLSAMSGPLLGRFMSPRTVVRIALLVLLGAIVWLLGTIEPHIDDLSFGFAMAVLGLGMGLLASQLGNVVQSSVGDSERSEVGGLQYTAQNLGSSLGTALIGSILISALVTAFTTEIENNPKISAATREEAGTRMEAGVSFISADEVRTGRAEGRTAARRSGRRRGLLRPGAARRPQSRDPGRRRHHPRQPRLHPQTAHRPAHGQAAVNNGVPRERRALRGPAPWALSVCVQCRIFSLARA